MLYAVMSSAISASNMIVRADIPLPESKLAIIATELKVSALGFLLYLWLKMMGMVYFHFVRKMHVSAFR